MRRRRSFHEVIREVKILGETFEIYVDQDGVFSSHVGNDYLRADTMKELLPQIQKAAKKQRVEVEIPATLMGYARRVPHTMYSRDDMTCHQVTLFGINPETMEIRFKFADGHRDMVSRHNLGDCTFAKPMTGADIKEWHRLREERDKATERFDTFVKKHEWKDVFGAVKKAMAAAVDDPKETPEADEDPRSISPK